MKRVRREKNSKVPINLGSHLLSKTPLQFRGSIRRLNPDQLRSKTEIVYDATLGTLIRTGINRLLV